MSINLKQLEINVNLHSLQPGFLNYELHYIIASDENTFRFVDWDESPQSNEQKFYCFYTEEKLFIPAGNVTLYKSYVLREEPIYPCVRSLEDFIKIIDGLGNGSAKCIKCFYNDDIDAIKNQLEKTYGVMEKHIVTSNEAQHLLLVLDNVEISVAATMVYFRPKAPFSEHHYHDAKDEHAND
jgi:hypothetical protein